MGAIFVAGVHGVGKTEACKSTASRHSLPHFTASELIKGLDPSAVKSHTKSVDSVLNNQRLLIHAVETFLSTQGNRLIFDGHFSVPNQASEFELISTDIFKQLQLDGIVVLHDMPSHIRARRMIRDTCSLDVREIERIQKIELQQGEEVAACLRIPFFTVESSHAGGLSNAVCKIWQLTPA